MPRSRNRTRTSRPPLVGRLHEMATTRPVPTAPASHMWWQAPHLVSVAKAAMARRLAYAMSRRQRPVVVPDAHDDFEVLDEIAGCERLDLSRSPGRGQVINPLTIEHALSSSPRVTTGEW